MERIVHPLAAGGRVLRVSRRHAPPPSRERGIENALRASALVARRRGRLEGRGAAAVQAEFSPRWPTRPPSFKPNPLPASIEVRLRPGASPADIESLAHRRDAVAWRGRCAVRPPVDSTADAGRRRGPRRRLCARGAARVCRGAHGGQRREARPRARGAKRFTSCSWSARRSLTSAGRSSSRGSFRVASERCVALVVLWIAFFVIRSRAGAFLGGRRRSGVAGVSVVSDARRAARRRHGCGIGGGLIAARNTRESRLSTAAPLCAAKIR